jgi:hypothetical protein
MNTTAETWARKPLPPGYDTADTLDARMRRIFDIYPGAVVVRTEPGAHPALCPRDFCRRRGIPPLLSARDGEATEIALAYPAYEAYVRYLARLAARLPGGAGAWPTVYWHDPDSLRGYRRMRIPVPCAN